MLSMTRSLKDRRWLVLGVAAMLAAGFLVTSLGSYWASRQSLRHAITATELPLTSDTIYSEIQKDLIQPVLISSVMATDTFLRDWIIGGEKDSQQVTQYLAEILKRYGAFTTFLVSDRTRLYYHADGVLKTVSEAEPRDIWYFRVRQIKYPYEINVDPDLANNDTMTIFINYRILDYSGNYIGVTGIGLTVNAVQQFIADYQRKYGRTVYFADADGKLRLSGRTEDAIEADLHLRGTLGKLIPQWSTTEAKALEYEYKDELRLLNVRFIPELGWYLLVEKEERGALADIRSALYMNLAICVAVTILVLLAVWMTIGRYQRRIEAMATTDKLTGLATRHAYDVLMPQAVLDAQRRTEPLCVLMIDVDHFKLVNDRYGHLVGDKVLASVATSIRASLRSSDIVCRWGGDEFVVALPFCGISNAATIAETIRLAAEGAKIEFPGGSTQVTLSIGLALLHAGENAATLMGRADEALRLAKESGRNCIRDREPAEAAG